MGRAALWVRAVDGISFDVERGEVFCLVGESGCGKTTTGKAVLRLVEVSEGDVFFEMPSDAYAEYEALREAPQSDDTKGKIDQVRRKYSLTWTETMPWTLKQTLLLLGMIASAFWLALAAPILLANLFANPFLDVGFVIGISVLYGLVLGIVASLPPTRPHRWTPAILALLSILGVSIMPVLAAAGFPSLQATLGVTDPAGILSVVWGTATFGYIVGVLFAAMAAGGAARVILSVRQQTEGLSGIKIRTLRRRLHLIFQDPYESLNPKQSVFEIVAEPLQVNRISQNPEEIAALVSRSLEDAGLRPAKEFMFRFPHELSGGQRQRVSVAAALALEPDFIVADEPVSMLDVSIRTEILQLMMDLRKTRGLTYLFITHDLSLAWVLADRIAVMYLGKIVEQGTAEQVIAHPKHPYTQALISVVPSPDPRHLAKRMILKGERPDPVNIPTGCRFHPRCPMAFEKCGWNGEEVAEAFQEAEREIAARIGGAILERETRVAELRKTATGSGTQDQALEDQAKALEREIQDLQPGRTRALALAEALRSAGPHGVSATPPGSMTADELVESLKALVNAQRKTRLPFKAVAEIGATSGGIIVRLHPWAEPELVEIGPGNSVACHLVSPPPKEEPLVASIS